MAASSSTIRMLCMRGLARSGLRILFRSQGDLDDETRAYGEIFFHADGAVMVFHNAAHDGEAKPGAALFCREVRKKKFFLELGGNAVAGIGDDELDGLVSVEDGGGDMD